MLLETKGSCLVVVGVQWGDEGKGKIVDVLSGRADLVVRYQGGANAGHTVVIGDDEIILHQVPTGILHPGTTCLIGNGVVLDPITLTSEVEQLEGRGVGVDGRLFISDRSHVVFPYHKVLDRVNEMTQRIGTTGRGIGPAYEAKYGRRGIRMADLRHRDHLESLLAERIDQVNQWLAALGVAERESAEEHLAELDRVLPRLAGMAADTSLMTFEALEEGRRVLLEGAQGSLLDVDHGTYPYVTSSNTTAGGAAVGAGIGPTRITDVLGVAKAYTTRVGNGPLPTELPPSAADRLRDLGSEFGATTGRPRRCGWLDAVVIGFAARINGLTGLAVTKLDVLDELDEIQVCTGYRLDGDDCGFPAGPLELDRIEPVYERLPGWRCVTTGARSLSELPRGARAYLDRIEELVKVPIQFVSVGTRRDQIIEVPG